MSLLESIRKKSASVARKHLLDPVRRARIHKHLPWMRGAEARLEELRAELGPVHAEYTTTVSTPGMAVSLETAVLLRYLCEQLEPQRILDLGSGLSSWVLRGWAATREGVAVTTCDDDADWLERSRGFLREKGVSTERVMLWSELEPEDGYDLIFHDLGRMPARIASLPAVLALGSRGPGGDRGDSLVVLDDVHKPHYAEVVARELARYEHTYLDCAPLTFDDRERFSAIVLGLRPHGPAS